MKDALIFAGLVLVGILAGIGLTVWLISQMVQRAIASALRW